MAINLIDILRSQLGDSMIKQASSFLGESEANTESALSGMLPVLLGTMAKKMDTNAGANAIFNTIKDGGFDGSMLNNLAGFFSGGQATDNLMKSGSGILDMLMGDKIGGVIDSIASFSGIESNSSKSLMTMTAPLLMSVIGKQMNTNNLGVTGLTSLLQGQVEFIQNLMPTGLASLSSHLGLNDLSDNISQATNQTAGAVRNTAANTTGTAKAGFGKILPWLGLLLLALLGAYLLRNCGGTVGDVADKVAETTDSAVEGAKDAAGDVVETTGDALSGAAKTAREALGALTFGIGSFGDRMSKFLSGDVDGDGRFTFDKVTFETGSAKLVEDSKEQLDNLATMLEAYPKVKINIEGYTDNTGNTDTNKTLSQDRAEIVRAYLVDKGIPAERMGAMGYGDANPVGDNATAEGRAQNRRIDVVVTER